MNIYCNNCGNEGHMYRNCKLPVLSYGILCFTPDDNLLMIRRKDSLAYIEFLRGKYDIEDIQYILALLNGCSLDERKSLLMLTFDELWANLWSTDGVHKKQTERMIKEYHNSKKKLTNMQKSKLLHKLCDKCKDMYSEPEWEFPKGRRSSRENNITCAIREFEEETDLSKDEYTLFDNLQPFSEEYTGSNGVRYKHIYYLALYKGSNHLSINPDKYEQFSEIGDIGWFPIDFCSAKLRKTQTTKHSILRKMKQFIQHWKGDFILKE